MWIDMIDPDSGERQHAALLLGTEVPTRDQASAIELSSRLRSSEAVLRLNVPLFVRTWCAFVCAHMCIITVHFFKVCVS